MIGRKRGRKWLAPTRHSPGDERCRWGEAETPNRILYGPPHGSAARVPVIRVSTWIPWWRSSGFNMLMGRPPISRQLCRAKPKGGMCSLYKWADAAFWLCRAELQQRRLVLARRTESCRATSRPMCSTEMALLICYCQMNPVSPMALLAHHYMITLSGRRPITGLHRNSKVMPPPPTSPKNTRKYVDENGKLR